MLVLMHGERDWNAEQLSSVDVCVLGMVCFALVIKVCTQPSSLIN